MVMIELEANVGEGIVGEVWLNTDKIELYWKGTNSVTLSSGDKIKLSNEGSLALEILMERGFM